MRERVSEIIREHGFDIDIDEIDLSRFNEDMDDDRILEIIEDIISDKEDEEFVEEMLFYMNVIRKK